MGDPAGIGPEIVVRACSLVEDRHRLLVIGDPGHLAVVAGKLKLEPPANISATAAVEPGLEPGRPRQADGRVALEAIARGADLATEGTAAALVTAPVSKSVIYDLDQKFKGHTEFLAERAGHIEPLMVFAAIKPAVALLTTHLPLVTAVAMVRRRRIVSALDRLDSGWKRWFGSAPRIAVAGLNPHAGEKGLLGWEDDVQIAPAIAEARSEGVDACGPYPADSVFRQPCDVILAMYHDQGTIIAKRAASPSVNTTFGLPYARTSPDHGVAYDIAGRGIADPQAMVAAIRLAIEMAGETR